MNQETPIQAIVRKLSKRVIMMEIELSKARHTNKQLLEQISLKSRVESLERQLGDAHTRARKIEVEGGRWKNKSYRQEKELQRLTELLEKSKSRVGQMQRDLGKESRRAEQEGRLRAKLQAQLDQIQRREIVSEF